MQFILLSPGGGGGAVLGTKEEIIPKGKNFIIPLNGHILYPFHFTSDQDLEMNSES